MTIYLLFYNLVILFTTSEINNIIINISKKFQILT